MEKYRKVKEEISKIRQITKEREKNSLKKEEKKVRKYNHKYNQLQDLRLHLFSRLFASFISF